MASEQVRLAGGKRLEVNTYEMARQSRKAETKDSENEVELKITTITDGKIHSLFEMLLINALKMIKI